MPAAARAHDQATAPAAPLGAVPEHPATRFQRTFPGRTDQVSQVRREIAAHLAGCPAADDLVLIASELAANAVLHSQSRGESFTVRCQADPACVRVEVEDLGGPGGPARPATGPTGWTSSPR
jgi:anti-sigma regulatory factor (Ser/Thr protein kinase)